MTQITICQNCKGTGEVDTNLGDALLPLKHVPCTDCNGSGRNITLTVIVTIPYVDHNEIKYNVEDVGNCGKKFYRELKQKYK